MLGWVFSHIIKSLKLGFPLLLPYMQWSKHDININININMNMNMNMNIYIYDMDMVYVHPSHNWNFPISI